MANLTNPWKSMNERLNEYDNLMKDYNTYDPLRGFLTKNYKKEYETNIIERMSLDHDDPMYLAPINMGMMVDMTNFIHENILDNMPLADLIKYGSGTRFKDAVEGIIIQDIMNIIRAENNLIDTYISAEPTLAEDPFWEEYNWSWDMVYKGCDFTIDNLNRANINEFDLLYNYLYKKDEMIANVKAKFGEKYFPTEKEYKLTFNVKATSVDDAFARIGETINDGSAKDLIEFV